MWRQVIDVYRGGILADWCVHFLLLEAAPLSLFVQTSMRRYKFRHRWHVLL